MSIVVTNIRLPFEQPPEEAYAVARKRLGLAECDVEKNYIYRRSLDARHKSNLCFVYSVGMALKDTGTEAAACACEGVSSLQSFELTPVIGQSPLASPPVVVGFGPAGLFAALLLARQGYCPVVLERGASLTQRVLAVEAFWKDGTLRTDANVQFGEGGAGTFSDGKLTTRINDPVCAFVLEELARHGAPEEILYSAKPHIGTDRLRAIVASMRNEIEKLGGQVHFLTPLEDIEIKSGRLACITAAGDRIPVQSMILAVGHSARDTFAMLRNAGLEFSSKPFSVGVRIEHLQSDVDRALYGSFAGHSALPPGEYQLSLRRGNKAVYTFCMCPGGLVVGAASQPGGVVVNGMSEYSRNRPNANSALAVSVDSDDYGSGAFSGIELQQRLEAAAYEAGGGGYYAPAQDVGSFLRGVSELKTGRVLPSYRPGVTPANLAGILPAGAGEMLLLGLHDFDRKLPGFADPSAILTGVESRTSSPVRIARGEGLEAVGCDGLYPCGEGAGYAGGIMSAAVDGLRAALRLMAVHRPSYSGNQRLICV